MQGSIMAEMWPILSQGILIMQNMYSFMTTVGSRWWCKITRWWIAASNGRVMWWLNWT